MSAAAIVVNIFFSIGENSLNSVYSLWLIVYRAILLYGEAAVNYKLLTVNCKLSFTYSVPAFPFPD